MREDSLSLVVVRRGPLAGGFLIMYKNFGPVAQLVRALPCHGRGQGFESLLGRLQTMICL